MIGYRRAAVALHGMHEEDRRLILAELESKDRATLEKFIEELDSLGFARDESLTVSVISLSPPAAAPASPHQRIQYATAAQMYAVLETEQSSLIAQLLKCGDWPWSESFIRMLDPLRRDRVRHLANAQGDIAPARKAALLKLTAARLQEYAARGLTLAGKNANVGKPLVGNAMRQALNPLSKLVNAWKR